MEYADMVDALSHEATLKYAREGYIGIAKMLTWDNLSGEEKDALSDNGKTVDHLVRDVFEAVAH